MLVQRPRARVAFAADGSTLDAARGPRDVSRHAACRAGTRGDPPSPRGPRSRQARESPAPPLPDERAANVAPRHGRLRSAWPERQNLPHRARHMPQRLPDDQRGEAGPLLHHLSRCAYPRLRPDADPEGHARRRHQGLLRQSQHGDPGAAGRPSAYPTSTGVPPSRSTVLDSDRTRRRMQPGAVGQRAPRRCHSPEERRCKRRPTSDAGMQRARCP